MFNHILVPLDGSLLAERAIHHADQFARVFGGKITLLQVLDPSPYHESQGAVEPLNWQIRKAEAEMYLQETAAKIRESGVPSTHALLEGCAPENIIDFARDKNVDLVVMTTHGVSGLSRWNTSSIVSKVLEKIYLPVLLIRAYQEMGKGNLQLPGGGSAEVARIPQTSGSGDCGNVTATSPAAVSDEKLSPAFYRRILLPIDSSRRAECALPAATTLATAQQGEPATVIMGAVISPPDLPIPAPYPEEIHQLMNQFMNLSKLAVENYLADMARRFPGNAETRIVEQSNISAAIHEMVDKENVDLVVLCAHGQTGATSYPYGSVARNYLEHGTQNVLVIQDVSLAQVRPTAVENVVEKYGRR